MTTAMALLAMATPALAQSTYRAEENPTLARPVTAGAPVQIYRRVFENWTPIWIDLADMGDGTFVLSALDGLSGNQNITETFSLRSNGRRGLACRLDSSEGLDIALVGCPIGRNMQTLRVTLLDMRASVRLFAVDAYGALDFGVVSDDVSPAQTERRCLMPTLNRQDYFGGNAGATSVVALRQALASLLRTNSAASQLPHLRTVRRKNIWH